ncbi:hypothetical protein [Methanocella conradii]|uniref:hypothetical protein n=1 Tax=Methanocella conradii TaxID=1175444 RepID=UPI0024B35DFB|nr:hypothetical protein [Methanocella conradii]MDI6897715.1 hypothetical protein [Methanocella conradii]
MSGQSGVIYTSRDVEDVFRCLSTICTAGRLNSPQKSNPLYRRPPPLIRVSDVAFDKRAVERERFSFHLPPDYRFLYPAATLAYYLGASLEADGAAFIELGSGGRILLPNFPEIELWMGDMLRRTFYLDCAVRYAVASGGALNGLDVRKALGRPAVDVFYMRPDERLLLYHDAGPNLDELPVWHMAAYLDPVPESVEALPYLLHSLSAIYSPRSSPMTERSLVSLSVNGFLGRQGVALPGVDKGERSVVVPSLMPARSQLWFSEGYPVDAVKATPRAFMNSQRYPRKKKVRVGIICNEADMSEEVDVVIEALSDAASAMQVFWGLDVSGFSRVFARGFDIIQLIGHCDERGFKCRDGFAKARDIEENNTPMFFFNSCSSHAEAAKLVDKGSACGVATFYRVLEEAAVDVCRNFYLMLGAGYPAYMAIDAARECSVLGKEYILIGDGSYCFGGDGLKPLYRISRHGEECTLSCTIGNVQKGYVVSTWSPEGKKMASDLGFETRFMSPEQLSAIAMKFKGFCIYNKSIYTSVREAAMKAAEDSRDDSHHCKRKRPRPGS